MLQGEQTSTSGALLLELRQNTPSQGCQASERKRVVGTHALCGEIVCCTNPLQPDVLLPEMPGYSYLDEGQEGDQLPGAIAPKDGRPISICIQPSLDRDRVNVRQVRCFGEGIDWRSAPSVVDAGVGDGALPLLPVHQRTAIS